MTGHAGIGVALMILVPLALYLFSRMGELRYAVIMLAVAAVAVLIVPHIPGSPIACLAVHAKHGNPCARRQAWVIILCFAVPLAVAGEATGCGFIRRRRRP